MSSVTIRDAVLDDCAPLLAIYRHYVVHTAITFEWDIPTLDEFRARMAHTMQRYPYLVAERDKQIIGYAYADNFYGRRAYDWSVEMTVYLAPDARHQGVGKELYRALEDALQRMGILNLNACIAYPQTEDDEYLTTDSANFHEKLGYRLVGTFHDSGYKFGRWYDMIWMEKLIGDHAAKTEDPLPYPLVKNAQTRTEADSSGKAALCRQIIDGFTVAPLSQLDIGELYEIMRARADVFVSEEGILDPELDGFDDQCLHVFESDDTGQVNAYLRMFPKKDAPGVVQMGRVLTRIHGQGDGARLLAAAQAAAVRCYAARELFVESQKHAQGFYEKAGFTVCSDDFMEAGIVHVGMRKVLS